MKKLIAVAVAALISFPALAGEWFHLGDSDAQSRLLGKTGSLKMGKNKHNVLVITGTFAWVTNSGKPQPFEVAITGESCDTGGGEMAVEQSDGGHRKYWWSRDGSKMYDLMGEALCVGAAERLELLKKTRGQKQDV